MTKHVEMEDDKEIYEAFLRMSKMVDIMYEAYEKRIEEEEKKIAENNAPSTPSSEHSSPSLSSHHSNEENNQSLQEIKLNLI